MTTIGMTTFERLTDDALDADTPEYLTGVGIDGESAGLYCGRLAVAGVQSLGFESPREEGTRTFAVSAVGAALTTAALCGFELGVRAALELRAAEEPCEHTDGWVSGCARCEANMDAALGAMEASS